MGLFSKIVDFKKKVFKGAAKIAGKVVKTAWHAVKSFASSTIGKIIIAAVLIYFGGIAIGAWQGFGASAAAGAGAGAGAGAASTAGAVAATGEAAGTAALAGGSTAAIGGTGLAAGEVAALNAGTIGGQLTIGGVSTGAGAATGAAGTVGSIGAGTVASAGASDAITAGILGSGTGAGTTSIASSLVQGIRTLGTNYLEFAAKNPALTIGGMSMLGSALTPSAAEEQAKYDRKNRARWNENWQVGDIDLSPLTPNRTQTLRTVDGARVWDQDGGLVSNFRDKVAANTPTG